MLKAQHENSALIELIHGEIERRGPQSFVWFMEQALYHPEHGFYSTGRAAIGRHGDYFTNVSIGPLFGRLLAAQFEEIWSRLGKVDDFVIVEQGAHHGEFARDVLESAGRLWPDFFAALHYEIIEPWPILQQRQMQSLNNLADRVRWRRSIDELEPFTGVHFSNELLDSFPVRLLVSTGNGWQEEMVGFGKNEFIFVKQPIRDAQLLSLMDRLPERPAGYRAEVNPAAVDWIESLSKKLKRGCVLVVDYGLPREQKYESHRTAGTLQVRMKHRRLDSPFDEIGRADITAHIDWTTLAEQGEQRGMRVCGFTDQHHFLTGILSGFPDLPEEPKAKRSIQTLIHPEMLGRAFQVLALENDTNLGLLSGFKVARDPRVALGL